MRNRIAWNIASLGVAVLFVYLWQVIADAHVVSPVFLPGPHAAWNALVQGFATGRLQSKCIGTIERMLYGWLVASAIGIGLGAIIGSSARARSYLGPSLEFLRPLPPSAIVPVAIAIFGIRDETALIIVAFGALWPTLLGTIHGFAAVEPRLYEVAGALRLSRAAIVWKIALPSSVPDIFAGLRLGLTVSLILTVLSEMVTSRDGLGTWIFTASRSFRTPDLFAGIILIGALGYVSARLIDALEARVLRWQA